MYWQFDYMLQIWNGLTPKRHCSVHVLMPTGMDYNLFSFCISTNMKELVIEKSMSKNATNSATGILKYMLQGAKVFGFREDDLFLALKYHPKLVAYNMTASKLLP